MSGICIRIEHVPHHSLNPNSRGHELKRLGRERVSRAEHRATLKQSALIAGRNYLLEHPWRPPPPPARIGVELFVNWPADKGAMPLPDDDNLIAACKSLFDGLAQALGVDDRRFKILGVEQALTAEDRQGFVVAKLTSWEG